MKRLVLFLLAIAMIATLSANAPFDVQKPKVAANLSNAKLDKVEVFLMVCGYNPDGVWACNITVTDDGLDCYIFDIEGAPDLIIGGSEC